jgi:hypothetical protein
VKITCKKMAKYRVRLHGGETLELLSSTNNAEPLLIAKSSHVAGSSFGLQVRTSTERSEKGSTGSTYWGMDVNSIIRTYIV